MEEPAPDANIQEEEGAASPENKDLDGELEEAPVQDAPATAEEAETRQKSRDERIHKLYLKAKEVGLDLTEEQISKAHTTMESMPLPKNPRYETYRIHIGGFPLNCQELQIIDFLSQFGEVYDLYMQQLPNGRFRGMVKVTYQDNPDIENIIKTLNGTVYHSACLKAARALSRIGREQYKVMKYGKYAGHPELNKDYNPTAYNPRQGKPNKTQMNKNDYDRRDSDRRDSLRDNRDNDRRPYYNDRRRDYRNEPPRRDYRDDPRSRDPRDYRDSRDYYRDPRDAYAEDPRDSYRRDPRDAIYEDYARREYEYYRMQAAMQPPMAPPEMQRPDPMADYNAYYYQTGYYQ